MTTIMDGNTFHTITTFLIHNQEHLKNCIEPYKIKRDNLLETEPNFFKDDILKQYDSLVKLIIGCEVTKNLACSYEDVIIILESLDLKEYLK